MDLGENNIGNDLDKLEVWVRAKDFAVALYKGVVPYLPSEEKWNLTQQLKRAAQSIPANIAEVMDDITFWTMCVFVTLLSGH